MTARPQGDKPAGPTDRTTLTCLTKPAKREPEPQPEPEERPYVLPPEVLAERERGEAKAHMRRIVEKYIS